MKCDCRDRREGKIRGHNKLQRCYRIAVHFAVSRERSNWIRGGRRSPVPRRRPRRRAPSRQQSLHGTADCKNVLTVNKCSVEQEELVVVSFAHAVVVR